jgi:hypothetical protein
MPWRTPSRRVHPGRAQAMADLAAVLSELKALRAEVGAISRRVDATAAPPDPASPIHRGPSRQLSSRARTGGGSEAAGHAAPAAALPPPGAGGARLIRTLSLETGSSEDEGVIRPAAYTHAPEARVDTLEEADPLDLESLKTDQYEGVYNVAALVLVFAMVRGG